jgi:steroid 5-alpha reductase family enzyme
MFNLHAYLLGLGIILLLAVGTWIASLIKRDVSIVDSLWSLLFLAAAAVYTLEFGAGPRAVLMLALTAIWSLRLAIYLTIRNWRQPEDYRYQKIRAANQPYFEFKSLYLVFLLQGMLAWIVSLPLFAAAQGPQPLSWLDGMGIAIVLFGVIYETIADAQLARFKSNPDSRGKVMDQGVWRYSRHPNYFGECCVWWGFYLLALAGGGWWSVIGPLLMTFLLLKISGVAMLERDIGERRPGYRRYVETTNAFFPGIPKARS